ncbi:hypothetical protein WQ57_08500 [Mesobacillus campisalis]|uniref:YxlC family protein n=1 Tax=Mesobacillus campisalis TaxID=1408103 RepID=A0A0M2SVM3_9BACI|nr:YxlC family protein [Mesobacillus campisalis]KKK38619.1 hypothetical protein WQ57_08500 [Mesobacillus campisalis]
MVNMKEDQEQLKALKRDWKQLDELGDCSPASLMEMKAQLASLKVKQKKKLYRELCIFLSIAVFILSMIVMGILKQPSLFIALQAGASLLAPMVLYVLFKRKKQEGKVYS